MKSIDSIEIGDHLGSPPVCCGYPMTYTLWSLEIGGVWECLCEAQVSVNADGVVTEEPGRREGGEFVAASEPGFEAVA